MLARHAGMFHTRSIESFAVVSRVFMCCFYDNIDSRGEEDS